MKLVPMKDFIINHTNKFSHGKPANERCEEILKELRLITYYACFIKQSLKLWMLIPCGEDGKPLTGIQLKYIKGISEEARKHNEILKKAKERVLFEGFSIEKTRYNECYSLFYEGMYFDTYHFKENGFVRRKNKTVEDLINDVPKKIELTSSAEKQIGL